MAEIGLSGEPGFGVYVHWPFCAAKCPYCDFNSHVRHNAVDQSRFAAAFAVEIRHMAALTTGKTVTSIFFGGGTPSLMEPQTLDAVLSAIQSHWALADDIEITLEANPSSVEAERFRAYRAAGINRVSLGVQSLNDKALKFLGRLHNAREAIEAVALARDIFPRMSFDLIYARPNQQVDEWRRELEQAIALAADHLSLYQLTIEEGTPFFSMREAGKLFVPDADNAARLYEATQSVTTALGLPAYEISNHAGPGAECRHNLTYWRYGDYAGVGPGAHGRLSLADGRHALAAEKHPETWLTQVEVAGSGIVVDDLLTFEEAGDEMLLMGLRLREGFDVQRYTELTGRTLDQDRIRSLLDTRFVEWTGSGRLRATSAGWLVLDAVIADLAA